MAYPTKYLSGCLRSSASFRRDKKNMRLKERMMNLRRLIRNWHIKATKEEDYFSKFVFEYLAFIAHVKTQLYLDVRLDRDAIQRLKQDENLKERYLLQIQSNPQLKNDWQHIKNILDSVPLGNASMNASDVKEIEWWNCAYNNLCQRTNEEKQKTKGVIYSLEDWENMVEFWYSVRNNLFHGTKNPESERDQFAVEYSYRTLRELVELYVGT
jgi:hypothetical protein